MTTTETFLSLAFFQKLTLTIPTAGVALVFGYLTYRIAREQKNIQKEKVLSDLFDRRFSIYCSYKNILEAVFLDLHLEELNRAIADAGMDIRSARFLLDGYGYAEIKKVDQYIDGFQRLKLEQAGVWPRAELNTSDYQIEQDKRNALDIEIKKLVYGGLDKIFEPYLTLSDFRNQSYKGDLTAMAHDFDGIAWWHQVLVLGFSVSCFIIPSASILFYHEANLLFIIKIHSVIAAIFSSILWLQAAKRSSNVFPNSLAAAFTGIATLLGTAAANDISLILSFVLFFFSILLLILCSLSIIFPNIRAKLIPS